MPLSSLPVDSAISCSAQSPKPGMPESVVAEHHLVDAGRVGHAEQGTEAQPGVVGVVALEVRLDGGRLVEQPPDVGAGEPARHQPERGQRRVAAAHVGVGVEHAVAGLGGRVVERGARVGDHDDVRRRLEVGVAERLFVGPLLAVGLDGPAGLAGDDHDGALELFGQGAAYVVGVGGVEDRELHAVGRADDLGGERGAAHAAEHDAGAAAVGQDVTQADDLVDQCPGLLGETDPGQPRAGLGLGGAAPERGVPAGDAGGDAVGDELLDGAGEGLLVGVAEGQLEPVVRDLAPAGHFDRAPSRLSSTVASSSFQDFTNLSTPSFSRVAITSS